MAGIGTKYTVLLKQIDERKCPVPLPGQQGSYLEEVSLPVLTKIIHRKKSLSVLASRQKITKDRQSRYQYRNIFPFARRVFYIPPCQKSLPLSLDGDFLHSLMPKMLRVEIPTSNYRYGRKILASDKKDATGTAPSYTRKQWQIVRVSSW